jgi:hypothetical protein
MFCRALFACVRPANELPIDNSRRSTVSTQPEHGADAEVSLDRAQLVRCKLPEEHVRPSSTSLYPLTNPL